MCRNDAAREEELRDRDKSLLSEKGETQENCTGRVFHLLQTWSLPSRGGKHKGCQHWRECCDSAGQPHCRTHSTEDEGRVSQPQHQETTSRTVLAYLGTPSRVLLLPRRGMPQIPPSSRESAQREGLGCPTPLYNPSPVLRGIVTHNSTAQPQGQHGTEQGTSTQIHFSPSASVPMASDFTAESHKEGVSSPFPKGSAFPATENCCNSKNAVQHRIEGKKKQPQTPVWGL